MSRALRTIPLLIEVARDIEGLCPSALFINFTNPMTVSCRAVAKTTSVRTAGLRSGVTSSEHFLARFVGVPWKEIHWTFPCVGDGHIYEFMPGWQGECPYYGKTFGIDGGHNFEAYAATFDQVFQEMADQAYGRAPIAKADPCTTDEAFSDEDLFIDVLSAAMGEDAIFRTVNLPNEGQATNLPGGAVPEATMLIDGMGFQPLCFGELPPGITAILQRIIGTHELTVQAALKADRKRALQALIAGETVRTEAEATAVLDAILDTHRAHLPQFYI